MTKAKQSEALKGNKNAKRGTHKSFVLRVPVHVADVLYECLQSQGELIEEDKVKEFALSMLGNKEITKIALQIEKAAARQE